MITLKNVRKTFGTRRVLERVSFSVGQGQKVALVGQNGVGKSTLLRIMAGLETYDKGEISKSPRLLVGYLPQESELQSRETLLEYLRRMAGLVALEEEMKRLEKDLDNKKSLQAYEAYEEEYRRLGGYAFIKKAKKMLEGLRLANLSLERPVAELSGGEKRKAALAGVLLRGVDLLLLDEPTNNLDLEALLWLEEYLKRIPAACIIASHDRKFLDQVSERVIELDWHKREALLYGGGWSEYTEVKAHRVRKHKELYRLQEEEKERLKASGTQKMSWVEHTENKKAPDHDKFASNYKKERAIKKFTTSAKVLEARVKRLNTIEKPLERVPIKFVLEAPQEKYFAELKDVRFGYPGAVVGQVKHFKIPAGKRVAFLGANGAGKTTLLKTLIGEIPPLSGHVERPEGFMTGNLLQEHENIPRQVTAGRLLAERLGNEDPLVLHEILGRFQFSPDTLSTRIEDFSPGERVRFVLALLSAKAVPALMLDEPTNHLDLDAITALEEALEEYPGTLLLVSHDREFLKKMRIDEYYLVKDGQVKPLKDPEMAFSGPQTKKKK